MSSRLDYSKLESRLMILKSFQIEDSDERLKIIAQVVALRTGASRSGAVRGETQKFYLSDFAYIWNTTDLREGIRTLRDDVFQAARASPRLDGISNRHFVEDLHELRQMLRGKDGRSFAPLEFSWKLSRVDSMPAVFHALLRKNPDPMDDCSTNIGPKTAILFGLALGHCQRVVVFNKETLASDA